MGKQMPETATTYLTHFLQKCGGYGVLDGGFATELERLGADLNDPLWSAKCLLTSPHLVRRVHLDYLDAGANIISTASYQATLQGFEAKGFSRDESEDLLRKSVQIAIEARDIYLERCTKDSWDFTETGAGSRRPVLIAASIGSYGAYLADGSEYSGEYGESVTLETLKNFHRRRVQILANAGADLIAFETIPNKLEAQVRKYCRKPVVIVGVLRSKFNFLVLLMWNFQAYAELLDEEGIEIPAWFSFNSKDGINVVSGDSISDCASIADASKQVVAVGINCTPPRYIHGLILSIQEVTDKPIVVYPNSGETYDGVTKQWLKSDGMIGEDFVSYVRKWKEAGASLFGGCCRTTPNTIRGIAKALSSKTF
uniref:Hcy-binding domain-containing protein n=1 Tax=Cucumis melo TaxID=3656 RepID=A0A9I9D8C2_CUCME